jgi:hypothetical protein
LPKPKGRRGQETPATLFRSLLSRLGELERRNHPHPTYSEFIASGTSSRLRISYSTPSLLKVSPTLQFGVANAAEPTSSPFGR